MGTRAARTVVKPFRFIKVPVLWGFWQVWRPPVGRTSAKNGREFRDSLSEGERWSRMKHPRSDGLKPVCHTRESGNPANPRPWYLDCSFRRNPGSLVAAPVLVSWKTVLRRHGIRVFLDSRLRGSDIPDPASPASPARRGPAASFGSNGTEDQSVDGIHQKELPQSGGMSQFLSPTRSSGLAGWMWIQSK
jgi:hypothetical protein